MTDDPLRPGGALGGRLFRSFLERLNDVREPEPGEHIGPWKIVGELGRGGSGVVYLAERDDGAYSQQVALKWLRADRPVPGGRAAMARERELLASLDHPNIARLIDGGETDDGMRWFAMDLAPGETVDRAVVGMDRRRFVALVQTLCRAVHHAHRRGLIHGDIKPSNVLVDERDRPRLVDFGISRLRHAGAGGSYGMTPDYASPEQRRGEALTTASDIWQLGHLLKDLAEPPRLPTDLRAVVERATEADPSNRYASAAAMAADLGAWLSRRPVEARNGGPVYRLLKGVSRNRAVSAVTALALLVIVGGGAWTTWQIALERDRARIQAERAEAALADTEDALARAEALGDFLVDLFEATRPDRPRDQLPSTEDILDRGARRALAPDSAPPGKRFDMLVAIGQVYRARGRYDEAEPLLSAAVRLAGRVPGLPVEDRANALEQRARLMLSAGDPLDDAEALLIEAESLLDSAADEWDMRVRVRVTRSWVERYRGRHDRALALVESARRRLPSEAALRPATRARLYDSLAGLYRATGDLASAARFRDRSLAAYRRLPAGEEGQGYVVSLANSVGLELARGSFETAERRARRAIELYDRIYPEPVDYRAALRRSLARVLMATGRVDEAFESLRRYGDEYARVMDKDPGEWPLFFSHRGHFRMRLGRLEEAIADLRRAGAMLRDQGGYDERLHAAVDVLLAEALCRAGEPAEGQRLIDELTAVDALRARPRSASQLLEARSACALAGGDPDAALDAVNRALALQDAPGLLVARTDRRLLKARVFEALERADDAGRLLESADREFLERDLPDHPLRSRVLALQRHIE